MDAEDKDFELIATRAELKDPLPRGISRSQNGFSRQDVINAFARAFEMIGGVQRMALWANQNPDKFYPLYSKLLPSTAIQIGDNNDVTIIHAIPQSPLDEHPAGSGQGPLSESSDEGQPEVARRSGA